MAWRPASPQLSLAVTSQPGAFPTQEATAPSSLRTTPKHSRLQRKGPGAHEDTPGSQDEKCQAQPHRKRRSLQKRVFLLFPSLLTLENATGRQRMPRKKGKHDRSVERLRKHQTRDICRGQKRSIRNHSVPPSLKRKRKQEKWRKSFNAIRPCKSSTACWRAIILTEKPC